MSMLDLMGLLVLLFLEQALIDLGRSLTSWVYKWIVTPNHVVFALNSVIKGAAFEDMKKDSSLREVLGS